MLGKAAATVTESKLAARIVLTGLHLDRTIFHQVVAMRLCHLERYRSSVSPVGFHGGGVTAHGQVLI